MLRKPRIEMTKRVSPATIEFLPKIRYNIEEKIEERTLEKNCVKSAILRNIAADGAHFAQNLPKPVRIYISDVCEREECADWIRIFVKNRIKLKSGA